MTDREKGMLFTAYARLQYDIDKQIECLEKNTDEVIRENARRIIDCDMFAQEKIAEMFWEETMR